MDVNCALLTPSVARLLDPAMTPSLKTLVLGGELVSFADWERWGKSHADDKLLSGQQSAASAVCTLSDAKASNQEDRQGSLFRQLGSGS